MMVHGIKLICITLERIPAAYSGSYRPYDCPDHSNPHIYPCTVLAQLATSLRLGLLAGFHTS